MTSVMSPFLPVLLCITIRFVFPNHTGSYCPFVAPFKVPCTKYPDHFPCMAHVSTYAAGFFELFVPISKGTCYCIS